MQDEEEAEVRDQEDEEQAETRSRQRRGAGPGGGDPIEQSRRALLCFFIFLFLNHIVCIYVGTNPRKVGQTFLAEIYLFYYDLCVMSFEMKL